MIWLRGSYRRKYLRDVYANEIMKGRWSADVFIDYDICMYGIGARRLRCFALNFN